MSSFTLELTPAHHELVRRAHAFAENVIRPAAPKYDELQDKLRGMRENVAEVFRDANALAPLLPTIEDRTEVYEIP